MSDRATESSLSLLRQLFQGDGAREFAVRLWDGTIWEAEGGKPALLGANHRLKTTTLAQGGHRLRVSMIPAC